MYIERECASQLNIDCTFCPKLRPDKCVDAWQEDGEVGENAEDAGEEGAGAFVEAHAAAVGPLRAATPTATHDD
jgi:hypothetical protein